jgi:YHS domain-containing protein
MKMKTKMKTVVLLIAVLLIADSIGGCKKKEGKTNTSPATSSKISSESVEQTTCPVMGGAVDKNIYTTYKDKKVYFCCAQCKAAFEKEPEKYISKLPQFSK